MSLRKDLDRTGQIDKLKLTAAVIRKNAIENITKSGVGHPGGSLSVADLLTALYFGKTYDPAAKRWESILRHDPNDPLWPERDRLILGKGHAAPSLYATLAEAGFFSRDLLRIFRKIDSPLEGHPVMYRTVDNEGKKSECGIRGVDFGTGSLGHGLSAAAGMALHAKVYGHDYRVYAVIGDGDLQEGMTWEACLTIPNKKLSNICMLIDYNRLQVDGSCDEINCLDPLDEKLKAFNWEVRVVDGHDFYQIIEALDRFVRTRAKSRRPLAVIARTVKGKGVRAIENDFTYHALPLDQAAYRTAEKQLSLEIDSLEKKIAAGGKAGIQENAPVKKHRLKDSQNFAKIILKNPAGRYTRPTATRIGYGNALARLGEYEKIFVLNADLAGACGTDAFVKAYPENASRQIDRRSLNVGVQEANMMTMGAAIAACGKIPVVNSFGIFTTGRAFEMIRQDIAYPRLNVKIIGSHTGIALGEYGVSHQAIEDVGCMRSLPHICVIEPSDAVQADLLFEEALRFDGPLYFRVGRNPTPLFYSSRNSYGITPPRRFRIGKGYQVKNGRDITLICSGPILHEALTAAGWVKESVRVLDMPTIRPIDAALIEKACRETGRICTVQDHFETGGLKDEVLSVLAARRLETDFSWVALSGFAESGSPKDLYEKYGLSANAIIDKLGLTRN